MGHAEPSEAPQLRASFFSRLGGISATGVSLGHGELCGRKACMPDCLFGRKLGSFPFASLRVRMTLQVQEHFIRLPASPWYARRENTPTKQVPRAEGIAGRKLRRHRQRGGRVWSGAEPAHGRDR